MYLLFSPALASVVIIAFVYVRDNLNTSKRG